MKPVQFSVLSCALFAFLPQISSAAPLVSIGDNADLFFNGSSSVRWTSNLFRDHEDEEEDVIFTLSPGFELNVGRGVSNADLSIITRYDIIRYDDFDEFDTETFHIKAVGSYSTSRLDLSGSVSFDEQQTTPGESDATDDLDALIETDNIAARIDGEYRFSPKFSFGAGASYREREYTTFEERFADRETVTVPFDLFYELTPKVDLSAGYTYSHSDVEETTRLAAGPGIGLIDSRTVDGFDTESHFFNVGARGNLLPKLNGFFKIGYRVRESDDSTITRTPVNYIGPVDTSETDRDDNDTLGIDGDLTWSATPKLTVRTGFHRDFGVGGEGETSTNTGVDVNVSYSIGPRFAASSNLGYTLREFEDDGAGNGRDEDQFNAGVRLSFTPDQHWRFSTGYNYTENDSDDDRRDYENHMIDLTASLRY